MQLQQPFQRTASRQLRIHYSHLPAGEWGRTASCIWKPRSATWESWSRRRTPTVEPYSPKSTLPGLVIGESQRQSRLSSQHQCRGAWVPRHFAVCRFYLSPRFPWEVCHQHLCHPEFCPSVLDASAHEQWQPHASPLWFDLSVDDRTSWTSSYSGPFRFYRESIPLPTREPTKNTIRECNRLRPSLCSKLRIRLGCWT